MKYTNFMEELDLIHTKEVDELKQALEAHGGEYEFGEALEDRPQVVAEVYYEWKTIRVGKVGLDSSGEPYLCGDVVDEYAGYYTDEANEVSADKVKVGEMQYIIGRMDDPKA